MLGGGELVRGLCQDLGGWGGVMSMCVCVMRGICILR